MKRDGAVIAHASRTTVAVESTLRHESLLADASSCAAPASAPYCNGGNSFRDILRRWTIAAGLAGAAGAVLFGPIGLLVLITCLISAVAADMVVAKVVRNPVTGGLRHAALFGLLLGLTLPATTPWYVSVTGSIVTIAVRNLFGARGHFLWHPAMVGRLFVQVIFLESLSIGGALPQLPVLAPGHLLFGNVTHSRIIPPGSYQGWEMTGDPLTHDALMLERPLQILRRFTDGRIAREGDLVFTPILRDQLPPWRDLVLGTVPGAIGETCVVILVIAGLYLIYCGYLRWQLPVTVLASAALAAAILPIQTHPNGGYHWLPALAIEQGHPVGLAYVLYHLACGPLVLTAFLLAGDMMLTPMRTKGQVIFAVGVGVISIFLRLYGPLEGGCFWAILGMNTLVPTIDRRLKRPVLGMAM